MLSIIELILPFLAKVLEKFIPDPAQRAEAERTLTELLIANQGAIASAAKDVMVADSQSGDAYTSRARPTVVYWSLGLVTLLSSLSLFDMAAPILEALKAVPDKLWDLMTYGIGAYMLGRSVEKTASDFLGGRK
jgi:hypothetical protein